MYVYIYIYIPSSFPLFSSVTTHKTLVDLNHSNNHQTVEDMMSKMVFITGVLTVVVLLLLSPSTAEIKTITITSDTRPLILFEKFGFTYPGRVAIAASSVAVVAPSSQPNLSRLGFFLISEKSLPQFIIEMEQNPTFCILNSPYTSHLFTFLDLPPPPATFNSSYSSPITEYSSFSRRPNT